MAEPSATAGKCPYIERTPPLFAGLKQAGINSEDIDRYLGTIEERVRKDQTGSRWALRALTALDCERNREAQYFACDRNHIDM